MACFAYLYNRLNHAAAAEGSRLLTYLAKSFENVNWYYWLALMIPYCFLYLIFDSLVVWSVINWFNAKIRYADILPIRASAYILSLVNEQVSKGAIALYLNRRDGVPGWEVGSSMLLIMFCEYLQPDPVGDRGRDVALEQFPAGLPHHSLDCLGRGRVLRAFPFVLQRKNRPRDRPARPPDLPGVPAGQSVALRRGDSVARAAGTCWRGRLYAGLEAVWRLGRFWRDAGLSCR